MELVNSSPILMTFRYNMRMPDQKFAVQYKQLVYQVKRDPANAEAWEALGDLLAEAGQTQRAQQCYRRVLSLRPDDLEAKVNYQHLIPGGEEDDDSLNGLDNLVSGIQELSLTRLPTWFQIFLALFSFLVTLLLATTQKWQVVDLVWSLWISSLTLGYAYLLTGIAAKAIHSGMGAEPDGFEKALRGLAPSNGVRWGVSIGAALVLVAFFTIHFGMFHFVHSVFLNLFFPLAEETNGFPNVFKFISICIINYWPVVLLSALSQLPNFLRVAETEHERLLTLPYSNVVKMHISIFVFAGLSALRVDSAVMIYLLILYFFPFGALTNLFKRPQVLAGEA